MTVRELHLLLCELGPLLGFVWRPGALTVSGDVVLELGDVEITERIFG